MKKETLRLCPSSRCKEGSLLLGIVNAEGSVDILANPLPIDDTFIQIAEQGREPEKRFRFVNKCVEGGCQQWTGSRCGVIDTVLLQLQHITDENNLPLCNIRSDCRWFSQTGEAACKTCTLVVTQTEY